MSKSTWRDVGVGDVVVMGGRDAVVLTVKPKGDRAKVTVKAGGIVQSGKVDLDDRVKIRKPGPNTKRGPLRDAGGAQQRWASEREHAAALVPGNPSLTKPPKAPSETPWDTTRDKAERLIVERLGGVLVAEARDEGDGYYVPPVDETTIASHMVLLHGADVSSMSEAQILDVHAGQHELAEAGTRSLHVNHWHTKTRPKATK